MRGISGLLDVSLFDGWLPAAVYALALGLFLYLAIRRPTKRWLLTILAALAVAAIIQTLTVLVIDHWLLPFGVPFEFRVWFWIGLGVGTGCIALANLWNSRWWRKVLALVAAVFIILAATLAVNEVYGQYPTLRDAFGLRTYPELPAALIAAASEEEHPSIEEWTAPADLPTKGAVYSVEIPASTSGFPARHAAVYLPPAALTASAPALPVLLALAGQPGEPSNVFASGQLDTILDRFSAEHGGLAPIVIAPDQLGTQHDNPMCVDGPLGNSLSYLAVDVRQWIVESLPVRTDRLSWTIAGFSQGGTCALQLGTAQSEIFGSFIDVSGEVGPTLGDEETTVMLGFEGSRSRFAAAQPLNYLKGMTLEDTRAVLAVGELDPTFGPEMARVRTAVTEAGVQVDSLVSPGTGHDWATARFGFERGIELLADRMGLGQ